nr:MAG TPA: Heat shock cognate 71 kDa-protein complex, ATP-binding, Chaperone, Nucleotide-binding [Caudoviricetes sp.]
MLNLNRGRPCENSCNSPLPGGGVDGTFEKAVN